MKVLRGTGEEAAISEITGARKIYQKSMQGGIQVRGAGKERHMCRGGVWEVRKCYRDM